MLKIFQHMFPIKPEQFIKAVTSGDLKTVKKYLAQNQNNSEAINRKVQGKTSLMNAVLGGDLALLEVLLSFQGIDVHAQDEEGNTAFSLSAYRGNVEIANLLKRKGANIHHQNKTQWTAARIAREHKHEEFAAVFEKEEFIQAVDEGNLEKVNYLMHYVDPGLTDLALEIAKRQSHGELIDLFQKKQFLRAAKDGDLEVVQKYLRSQEPALIHTLSQHSQAAFLKAIRHGRIEIVKTLITAPGINLNGYDSEGNSALAWAIISEHLETIDYLARIPGIKKYWVNSNWDSADLVASRTGRTDILQILDAIEADRLAVIKNQKQFLSAVEDGDLAQVKAFYEDKSKKIDVNYNYSLLSGNYSALYLAAQNGHKEVVDYLLEIETIDIAKATSDGSTLLFVAALKGHTDIARSLIETAKKRGQSIVNIQRTSDKTTALFVAAQEGHLETAKLLLDAGADAKLPMTTVTLHWT